MRIKQDIVCIKLYSQMGKLLRKTSVFFVCIVLVFTERMYLCIICMVNKFYFDKIHMVFTILAILSGQFSGIKYIYIVVKPSHHPSLLILQNHEILTRKTSLPPSPAAPGTSYQWNHTIFDFCDWFASLSIMSSRFPHIVAGVSFLPFQS